jgi:RHS repeat-associated protein
LAFTPVASDVLIAAVDFTNDTVTSLEGTNTTENGIAKGYVSGDLKFFANRFGGVTHPDEFEVEGTHFVRNETVSAGTLGFGVAAQDAATGTGYLMYSQESVHTRFAPNGPNVPQNADHFICVRYQNGQWEYDNNVSYFSFTPLESDVLVAEVDFANDTVRPLVGVGIDHPWMYTGRQLDAETGLFQYRNRYYHAQLARFVSRDPIMYHKSEWNLYEYARSRSLIFRDADGLVTDDGSTSGGMARGHWNKRPLQDRESIDRRKVTRRECSRISSLRAKDFQPRTRLSAKQKPS